MGVGPGWSGGWGQEGLGQEEEEEEVVDASLPPCTCSLAQPSLHSLSLYLSSYLDVLTPFSYLVWFGLLFGFSCLAALV